MFDLLKTIDPTQDIAYSWIVTLFSTDANAPLAQAFAVFTSSLAFLGALILAWFVLVGIVSSAYSGKVLGERWHQIWAPLRVVLGFGLLVPVGTGFSSVHYLLKDVIGVAAVNLGNAPIVAYVNSATDRNTSNKLYTNAGADIVRFVMERELCTAIVNNYNSWSLRLVTTLSSASLPEPEGATPPWGAYAQRVSGKKVTWWDYGSCGSLTFVEPDSSGSEFTASVASDMSLFHDERNAAMAALIMGVRSKSFIDYDKLGKYFAQSADWDPDTQTGDDMIAALQETGQLPTDLVGKTLRIGNIYNRSISASASKFFNAASQANATRLKSTILTHGFMAAGSYERSLSVVSGLTIALADTRPQSIGASFTNDYAERVAKVLSAIAKVRAQQAALGVATGSVEPEDESQVADYILAKIFTPNLLNMKLKADSVDPIGDMITFGHTLLSAASLGIAAMILGSAGGGFLKNVPGAGGALAGAFEYVSQWIGYLIMICLIVGLLHSFVLPMLPMIMVFVMGVSWLVLFLEAAIAGVLWAFAFIRMDGQEFFDKNQAPGVTLLFNLLMRPAIGMLAYCGMLLLLPKLLNSLAMIWDDAYGAQTGQTGWLVVWQWLAGVVLFTYMQWHLTLRITGLIPTIADRVGHWMGFSGMHGYNDGQETSAALGAMVGAGMAASRMPLPGGGRGGSPGRVSNTISNNSSSGGDPKGGEKGDSGKDGRDGNNGKDGTDGKDTVENSIPQK